MSDTRKRISACGSDEMDELQRAEERFRHAAGIVSDLIYEWDVATDHLEWFGDIDACLGFEPGEIPRTIEAWIGLIHPEDRARLADAVERHRTSTQPIFEEYRIENKAGEWLYWTDRGTPILDLCGRPVRWVGVCADMTERRRAEEERRALDAQIQHTQKLESLGVLAGGIAHDFNNLLVGVIGNAELALLMLSPDSPVRDLVTQINQAGQRAADLTNQLLAYSGKGKFIVETICLSGLVEEISHLLKSAVSKKAALEHDFQDDLPLIEADPTQVRQIVMNLITNASDAIGDESGVISIRTGLVHADSRYLSRTIGGHDLGIGDYVYIEVADTGCGMSADTQEKMFEPFYSTKALGRGLGLAAILGIVSSHKGAIRVKSFRGRGTTFRIHFPVAGLSAPVAEKTPSPFDGCVATGTVLVVDDEQIVRNVATEALERTGFKILTACDGLDALRVFNDHRDSIDVVLLDMKMPRLGGEEVFCELRRLRPDLPILLSSGYDEEETVEKFASMDFAGFIQKPYRVIDLVSRISELLTSRRQGARRRALERRAEPERCMVAARP